MLLFHPRFILTLACEVNVNNWGRNAIVMCHAHYFRFLSTAGLKFRLEFAVLRVFATKLATELPQDCPKQGITGPRARAASLAHVQNGDRFSLQERQKKAGEACTSPAASRSFPSQGWLAR